MRGGWGRVGECGEKGEKQFINYKKEGNDREKPRPDNGSWDNRSQRKEGKKRKKVVIQTGGR